MRQTKAHLKASPDVAVRDVSSSVSASSGGSSSGSNTRTTERSEMLSMDSDEETDWTVQQIHSVYESPFLDQFEPVKLLVAAAGGSSSSSTFNHRVFEAKKRSDGKLYAVKRIKLPAGKEARAQIMKELTVRNPLFNSIIKSS